MTDKNTGGPASHDQPHPEYIRGMNDMRQACLKACEDEIKEARAHNCQTEAVGAVWVKKAISSLSAMIAESEKP